MKSVNAVPKVGAMSLCSRTILHLISCCVKILCAKNMPEPPRGFTILDLRFTKWESFRRLLSAFRMRYQRKTPALHIRPGRYGRHSLSLLRKSHIHVGIISQSSTNRPLANSAFTPVKAEYAAQRAAFVPPLGGISCAAIAALSYALRADFITGLPVYFIERSDWFPLH